MFRKRNKTILEETLANIGGIDVYSDVGRALLIKMIECGHSENMMHFLLDILELDSIDIVDGPRFLFSTCLPEECGKLYDSFEKYIWDNRKVQIYVPNDCADKICYWLGILEEPDV